MIFENKSKWVLLLFLIIINSIIICLVNFFENNIKHFSISGILIIIMLFLLFYFVSFEEDSRFPLLIYPILFVFFSFIAILICNKIEYSYVFYIISILCAIFIEFLYVQYRKKIFFILVLALIFLFICYFAPLVILELNIKVNFYAGILLGVLLGFLASLISLLSSTSNTWEIQSSNYKQILASAVFLGIIISIITLYISNIGTSNFKLVYNENTNIINQILERFSIEEVSGGRLMFAEQILPIGSWIIPILSYFYGKLYVSQFHQSKNFTLLFSALLLSFILGYIFGIISLTIPEPNNYAFHPVHYPFMVSTWILITCYFYLIDSGILSLESLQNYFNSNSN